LSNRSRQRAHEPAQKRKNNHRTFGRKTQENSQFSEERQRSPGPRTSPIASTEARAGIRNPPHRTHIQISHRADFTKGNIYTVPVFQNLITAVMIATVKFIADLLGLS
jgi:hypothetical protein